MARRTFFSFHYQRDVWRVNQIRNIPNVVRSAPAGFHDASLWEKVKSEGDLAVKRLINAALKNTSVTVVCIGYKTAGRKYINYEIDKSIDRGNGIIGLRIHHLKGPGLIGQSDPAGKTPHKLITSGYKIYKFTRVEQLARLIEEAARAAGR